MSDDTQVIKDEDIVRGKIFRTAFPFLEDRPLKFFETCSHSDSCEHCGTGQNYCGRVIEKVYGFENDNDKTLYVLNRFKARYAMVLSTNVLNSRERFPNVIVAPIVGIHDDEVDKPFIKKIMNRDLQAFTSYYLDKSVTGKHCYVDLGKVRPVPKNWLLQDKFIVNDDTMFDGISERLGLMLAQKKLVNCEKCTKPCEKCDLKDEIEELKKQLSKIGA